MPRYATFTALFLLSLLSGNAGFGTDARAACCSDNLCRLYVIAGPTGSTYLETARRLERLLESPREGERRFAVKVLCQHYNSQELTGSVHNLYYLLHLAGAPTAKELGQYADAEDVGCDRLTAEDIPYVAECSLALAQADTAYLVQTNVLPARLARERELEEATAGDDADCGEKKRTGVPDWLFTLDSAAGKSAHSSLAGSEQLRAIVSLYREVLHLVVRYPLALTDLNSLGDFDVFVGELGSGTRVTATGLLNAFGIRTEDILTRNAGQSAVSSYPAVFDAMHRQRLDAFFVVATPPFEAAPGDHETTLHDLLKGHGAYLHPFSTGDILRLTEMFPLFASMVIPAGTYPGQQGPISTVGIDVLLVGTSRLPRWLAQYLVELLILRSPEMAAMPPVAAPVSPPFEVTFAGLDVDKGADSTHHAQGVPYHKGTVDFFSVNKVLRYQAEPGTRGSLRLEWRRFFDYLVYGCAEETHLGLLFGFVLIMALIVLGVRRLRVGTIRFINSHPFIAATCSILLLLLFAGTLTFLSEHRRSDFFSNPAEALFSVLVYLLSGFEDRAPVTLWGRAGSSMILVISPVMVALLTGAVFRAVQRHLSEGYVISRRLHKHYVICGWNDRTLGIVLQLRDELLKKETAPIVIVGQPEDEMAFARLREQHADYMHDVRIIARPPTDPTALYAAKVGKARAVIVLAGDEFDEEATLIVATLKGFARGWRPERRALVKRLHFLLYKVLAFLLPEREDETEEEKAEGEGKGRWVRAEKRALMWYAHWRAPIVLAESLLRSHGSAGSDGHVARSPSQGKHINALEKFANDAVFRGRLKVVKGNDMRSRAVAAAARVEHGGLVECLFKLLTFGTDSNELYPVHVADLFSRRRWRALCAAYHKRSTALDSPPRQIPFTWLVTSFMESGKSRGKRPIIPVAVREKATKAAEIGRFDTNPRRFAASNKTGLVSYHDELLVVAYRQPGGIRRKFRRWILSWARKGSRKGRSQ